MTRPELRDEGDVPLRERPIQEVADALQSCLGQRLVAYGVRERDPRRIGVFARAEDTPDEETEQVMRDLAEVTEVLSERLTDYAIRAIMIGSNQMLDGRAPIEVIHNGESEVVVATAAQLLRV